MMGTKNMTMRPGSVYQADNLCSNFPFALGADTALFASTPRGTLSAAVISPTAAYTDVLANAGARVGGLDTCDQRIINNVTNGTTLRPNGTNASSTYKFFIGMEDCVWPTL